MERLSSTQNETRRLALRLYIAGNAPNSLQALAHLKEIEQQYTDYQFEIEVVDTLQEPLRALEEGILVTPTLFKQSPQPEAKIIGNLSRRADVVAALNLTEPAGQTET